MEGIVSIVYQRVNGTEWSSVDAGVPQEIPVSLYVNGLEFMTFMCTPLQQQALAVGFLANEGLIDNLEEVKVARPCKSGNCIDVWLSHAVTRPSHTIITSGCGSGVTFDDLSRKIDPLPGQIQVTPQQIYDLMRQLHQAEQLYQSVRGIHTSALSDGQRLLLVAEDVGQHNTLDKVRGMAMYQGIETQARILLCSGRISSEMLNKAASMGVLVVVSRTSPTSLSLDLARAWGITLIGYAREDRMNVYTGAERLQAMP